MDHYPTQRHETVTQPIDSEIDAQCLSLLSSYGDPEEFELSFVEAGVWNNIVLKATSVHQTYYFKKYREFNGIPNYSPPAISAHQRTEIACLAQSVGRESFIDTYPLVPAVAGRDTTSFLMEEIPNARHLLYDISTGHCPESIYATLPKALARFHTATKSINEPILDDTRFRDYKVELQYNNVAQSLDSDKKRIIQNFADYYKQQNLCMVHGDLNSKNILLTAKNQVHVIDFEQAHLGTPAYDLAFILSELFIASVQFQDKPEISDVCELFLKNYLDTLEDYDIAEVARDTTLHLAAQIIYRFKGPSHKVWTSYVEPETKRLVLDRTITLIKENPVPVTDIFR
jgi:hypothetical protein